MDCLYAFQIYGMFVYNVFLGLLQKAEGFHEYQHTGIVRDPSNHIHSWGEYIS